MPIVEYSSSIRSHIENVERIQINVKRYSVHYPSLNNKKRCENTNILPLLFRREIADIKILFKSMYTNNFSSNVSDLVQVYIPNERIRSNRKHMLLLPKLLRMETYNGFY